MNPGVGDSNSPRVDFSRNHAAAWSHFCFAAGAFMAGCIAGGIWILWG